ncbi:EAL domain-containing protein [Altererythrobacter sp. GH1-8]|uniref:EAL domain-containing protein n=1 Tax=Altererythrobacter sp. GH1-8 TaxID=3349333 RepID=UPI00374D8938
MSENTRLEKTERWEDLIGRSSRSGFWFRLRHALWAGLLAFAFLTLAFFEPVDQVLWGVQSRLADEPASGRYAYVGADRDLADPYSPDRRSELAELLNKLDRAGVERVYLDFAFDQESSEIHDAALAGAVAALESRVAFVVDTKATLDESVTARHTIPAIRGNAPELINREQTDIFGFVWSFQRSGEVQGKRYESLASALLDGESNISDPIMVDYSMPLEALQTTNLSELLQGSNGQAKLESLKGLRVVIGPSRANIDSTARIPGASNIPPGIVAIYAAESHVAGHTQHIPAVYCLLIALLGLGLCIVLAGKRRRYFGYVILVASLPMAFFYSVSTGVRVELANCALMLILFALMRLRYHWQRRAAMHDDQTGLRTLRALEERLLQNTPDGYVVVAKIHGYERVLKLLPAALHPTYVRKIAERLKATEPTLEIFAGAHYFAWITSETNAASLEDHLNGLRAIFGAPLDIGGTPIDVGITFGAARTGQANQRTLPASMAAVEETTEAHEPVRFAVESSQDDGLWDISLRSRIDAAMNNGEVYCLYQPKYSLSTGTVSGVEALVRWDDHERGPIPPMVFVQESEKAGRIDQLTRYVLQSACTAGRLLHARGHRISVSVNVSAIQCSDSKIVRTVEETLNASGFPASHLVLEVTETARIRDLESAARVLGQLKQLGVKLSMDDFGVGMANYQTFYELPFDELKIDRLFIKNIQKDAKARAIASSVIQMGSEARITVTAEGVEDPEDLVILEEIGCTQVQGYAISRPITLPNLLDFLEKREKNMV